MYSHELSIPVLIPVGCCCCSSSSSVLLDSPLDLSYTYVPFSLDHELLSYTYVAFSLDHEGRSVSGCCRL